MKRENLLIICFTVLLFVGALGYVEDRHNGGEFNLNQQRNQIDAFRAETERAKVGAELAAKLAPQKSPAPSVETKPSPSPIPGGGEAIRLNLTRPAPAIHATPTPVPGSGDGKQVLDGKEVLDGKVTLAENDTTPELPRHPPLDFIPQIPVTSP